MNIQSISSTLVNRYRSIDKGLLYSGFVLILFGVFLILAAGPGAAERAGLDTFIFVKKQMFWYIPAFVVIFVMSFLSSRAIRRLCLMGLGISIILMVLTLFMGSEIKGAHRWISLFGFSIQPSEFMKPCFAVVCAWLLASGKLIHLFPGGTLSVILYGIIVCLLVKQPDLGMTIALSAIFGVQLLLTGISKKIIVFLGGFGVCGAISAYFMFSHFRARVNAFLQTFGVDGIKGGSADSYQVDKSLEALKNAGWFGKGPGEGIVKSDLPDAHTDFILAVSAEEFGFILTAVLICTFAFFIIRGFWLLRQENNYFTQIAVGGLLTQFAIQAIINMSSTLHLIPTKGMTLPFISYGGSSLISIGLAFGIILGLTRRNSLSRGLE